MPKVADVLLRLKGVTQNGSDKKKWMALCPLHDDHTPSLSITERDDGIALLFCHGCRAHYKDILSALGLSNGYKSNSDRKISKVYFYTDEKGTPLFQTVRFEPKNFCQRRPDGKGSYIYNLHGIKPVLYNLPKVISAPEVIIVEGEKDAENVIKLGFVATTSPMGAGKWKSDYNQYLKTKDVIIIPDNDEPGRTHALKIASSLHGTAQSIKILALPDLPDHGDVSDFISSQSSLEAAHERLSLMFEGCPEWTPGEIFESMPTSVSSSPNFQFPLTEVGNAERLVNRFGHRIRYCPQLKKWFIWNGKIWQEDQIQEIKSLAKLTVRSIYSEITPNMITEEANQISKHARNSEKEYQFNAMISLAQSEPGIAILPIELDRNPWAFNCSNGTLDLQTGELNPHSLDDFNSKISPVILDKYAYCPVFNSFLERIFNNNVNLISYLQRVLGYSLTGDIREQCFFMFYGTGANGKSTVLELFRYLLGGYARNAPLSTFLVQKNHGIPNDIAYLQGSRFVSSIELERGKSLSEAFVKQVTGGDSITARHLYKDFFEFSPSFKVFIATNHKPNVHGTDEGIWRRIRLVPFEISIPENQRDKDLLSKLKSESSGIFNWLLQGCLDWQKNGLGAPYEVVSATQSYRNEMDLVGEFIDDRCILKSDASVIFSDLFDSYNDWCRTICEDPLNNIQFGISLSERGITKKRSTGGNILRIGIGLKSE